MTDKTGGPAFPQSETLYEDGAMLSRDQHGGMTLRDWFAGNAPSMPDDWPAYLFIGDKPKGTIFPYDGKSVEARKLIEMDKDAQRDLVRWHCLADATWRFEYADAMLAERNK